MLHGRWSFLNFGRVNPLVPAAVVAGGIVCALAGYPFIGVGVAVGAVLALVNGVLLSRRVDIAAEMGDVGRALLIMQLGLLLSCTVVGLVTIVLVRISVAMAVASAAGFGVTHLGMLAAFYVARGRSSVPLEREAS